MNNLTDKELEEKEEFLRLNAELKSQLITELEEKEKVIIELNNVIERKKCIV